LRQTALRTCSASQELRQHYRLQTLQAAEREEAIRELLSRLRTGGVEPILIKGWSSARLYPEAGLRPSGDVDLCVPTDRLASATAALSAGPLPCAVDLHEGVPDLPDRRWREVFSRSRLVALGEVAVRVLGPEDQLRLLCLHLARHGIARPVWMCDLWACLESLATDFDWDYCLLGSKYLSDWAACVLGLTGSLLDTGTNAVPRQGKRVPPWVRRAVLWCWGIGAGRSLLHYLRNPVEGVRRLRYHGISPNQGSMPIKAALHLGLGPVSWLPLILVQIAAFWRRKIPHTLKRLVRPRRRDSLPFTLHHH